MSEYQLRSLIVRLGRRLHAQGLVSGTDGNISARLSENRLLVTPTGRPKAELRPRDLVVVDEDGRAYGRGRPTSELGMHLAVYRLRSEVVAAIHAHPPWTIAASIQPDMAFDFAPEGIVALAGLHIVPYARPGTPAVAEGLAPVLPEGNTFILARHGSLTLGPTLQAAYNRLENLEHNAKVALIALSAGHLPPLPAAEIEALTLGRRASQPAAHPARGTSTARISAEEDLIPVVYSESTSR